ncbi:MAG: roadblock/LC7 domain-containing protein [Candidatus Ranarchaeia archaeon]
MATKEDKLRSFLQNISKLSGVESAVLADEHGFPLSATTHQTQAENISALICSLKAKIDVALKELELDDLKEITLKTKTREILVTSHNSATLVVIRNTDSPKK